MLRLLGILALGNMIFGDNHHRRKGSFPGILFILPVLLFCGWVALAVAGGILGLAGFAVGSLISGLSSLTSAAFSGGGLAVGIVIGMAAFCYFRNRKKAENAE